MDETSARRLGRWIGIGLYLAVGFFYLASGLVVAWRASAERWWIALVSGPIAWAFWLLYVSVGEALLDWTA